MWVALLLEKLPPLGLFFSLFRHMTLDLSTRAKALGQDDRGGYWR
jgi:hypothetical protein